MVKPSQSWSSYWFDERGSHSVTFLTILVVSILTTCAAHRNLYDFINLTTFLNQNTRPHKQFPKRTIITDLIMAMWAG